MSQVKEPMFFILDGVRPDFTRPDIQITWKQATSTLDDYKALFAKVTREAAIGESSTGYLCTDGAAARIQKYLPNVKIFAVLRHPIKRAFSNYKMYVSWGLERLSFDRAVRAELAQKLTRQGWKRHYIRLGFYYRQLKPYFEIFGQDRIHVYLYDDFVSDPNAVLCDIYRQLGVDDTFRSDITRKHHVSSSTTVRSRTLNFFLESDGITTKAIKSVFPRSFKSIVGWIIRGLNTSKIQMKPSTARHLTELYQPEIKNLENLLDRDLSDWLNYDRSRVR